MKFFCVEFLISYLENFKLLQDSKNEKKVGIQTYLAMREKDAFHSETKAKFERQKEWKKSEILVK